jgi:hypothetical protein
VTPNQPQPGKWSDLLHPFLRGRPSRGSVDFYGCGHPRTLENSIGRKQMRCRICKRIASEEYRKKNPQYFRDWYRAHREKMLDYHRRYRAIKTVEFPK